MRRPSAKNKKGTVLLLTFIVMVTVTAIAVSFLYLISVQTKAGGYDIASHKALWVAEAGLQQAIRQLKNDSNFRNDPSSQSPLTGSVGDGGYSVTVSKNGSIYTLTSTGTVGILKRQISETVAVTSSALASAIHSDAASVDFTGSSGTVNGNIEAKVHVSNYGSMTINGTITEGVTQINPALDFDIYKTIAQSQSHYSTSNLSFANGTYSGVYYTTKNVTLGNNAVINGSVFAEGRIDFVNQANNITISPANNYPALATKGSISTSASGGPSSIGLQGSTLNGLIYADNNITLDYLKNNVIINGTLLADNNITVKNGSNFTINYTADIFSPMPPGFIFSGGDITLIPQKDWNEIVPAS